MVLADQSYVLYGVNVKQLLGDILLDRSNSAVMTKYVSSRDNLRILMNLLRVRCFTLRFFVLDYNSLGNKLNRLNYRSQARVSK